MNEREAALKDLKEQLDKIKDNNRQQIHLITLMADDYSNYAEDVVKLIVDHIKAAPNDLKVLGVYVMDSIIKFSGDAVEKYRRLFGNEIVKLFVDAFEKAPIAHRQNLFKVRSTWQTIFLKSKLFDLDSEVQKVDKSWPIFKQSVAVPPPVVAPITVAPSTSDASTSAAPTPRPPSASEVKKDPKPTAAEVSKKEDVKKAPKPLTSSKRDPRLAAAKAAPANPSSNLSKRDPRLAVAKVAPESQSAASPKKSKVSNENTVKNVKKLPTQVKTDSPPTVAKNSVPEIQRSPLAKRDPRRPAEVPERKNRVEVAAPSVAVKKEVVKTRIPATIKTEPKIPMLNDLHKPQVAAPIKRNSRPTIQREIPEKKRRIENEHHTVKPTAALGAHAFLPPPIHTVPPPTMSMPPPPTISPLGQVLGPSSIIPPQSIKMEIDDSWRSTKPFQPPLQMHPYNHPPPQIINSGPPMLPPTSMSSVITNETPKINGASSNNRIFVDGRAYEVIYINNDAVIERNGLPHRIYFSGPPRDILIDGKPFKLGFEDMRMIHIDGVPHPIRFGAPSRELYVGDHPFKGAFGGPPMVANINGRRHEFRLCGPPPEVRIDQDPCYELSRHMNAVRGPQAVKPKLEDKLGTKDVFALLQKIKQQGLLNKPSAISKAETSTAQKASPPGPRMDVRIARDVAPPSSIKDFQIGALMVRYSDVVEELHKARIACPHCGIGFVDTNSEAYQRHIDVHVQDLLRTKETGKSRSRQWYMEKNAWLEFDELAEVQRTSADLHNKHDDNSSPSADRFASSPSDAIATTSLNNICTVCHEKFNEYYDNDEEEWRYQDCVVKGNIAIHRYCVEQMEDGGNNETSNGNLGLKQEIPQHQHAFPV